MISTTQVLLTIQNLIIANKLTLLSGIIAGGVQREFEHITTSTLTPPTGYYFIAIDCDGVNLQDGDTGINSIVSTTMSPFEVTISVIDYIFGVQGENELYETMHNQFRTVCDRIQTLIYNQTSFISPDTKHKFKLELPKSVDRSDTAVSWTDAEQYSAVVAAEIRFTVEECVL